MLPSRKRVDLLQAGMILALLERKDQLQVPNQRATRYLPSGFLRPATVYPSEIPV